MVRFLAVSISVEIPKCVLGVLIVDDLGRVVFFPAVIAVAKCKKLPVVTGGEVQNSTVIGQPFATVTKTSGKAPKSIRQQFAEK